MVGGASDLMNGETVCCTAHRGLFMGNPPTDRQVEVQGMIFGRVSNGRIVEDWTLMTR
jgi:predicted ester cyclase